MTEKKKKILFYIITAIAAILILVLPGERGYYEYNDSYQYIRLSGGQGIMPIYPMLIHLHRLILGEELFLYGVVVTQTILAFGCIMAFLIWVRRRFQPGYLISGLIFLVTLVPFTLDMPLVMVNHSILTEALTYPLFYLYTMVFIETIIRKQYRWVCLTWAMSLLMALIRSQMQLCFVFASAVLLYVIWSKGAGISSKIKKYGYRIAAIACCFAVIVAGEFLLLKSNGGLWNVMKAVRNHYENGGAEVPEEAIIGTDSHSKGNVTGQFRSVLIDRTFYEMDEEDEELFEDPEVQKLFRYVYAAAEEEQNRYAYARKGLWKWQDIMNGTAGGTYIWSYGWDDYIADNPDSPLIGEDGRVAAEIGMALLKEHWPRMIYHTLCMLPQGFVASIFFQIEEIYGLCHLYTLLAYLSALVLVVVGLTGRKISQRRVEFMAGVLTLNILMVGVTCVVFFGMQRYLIYGFGIFYAACLLMLEDVWNHYGRALWKKGKSRF